jgi:hypothetical protein
MECLKECLKHLAFLRRRRIRNLHIPAIPGIWETGKYPVRGHLDVRRLIRYAEAPLVSHP